MVFEKSALLEIIDENRGREVAEEYEIWPVIFAGGVGRGSLSPEGAGGCSPPASADLRACPRA